MTSIIVRISDDTHKALKHRLIDEGWTIQSLVLALIELYLTGNVKVQKKEGEK